MAIDRTRLSQPTRLVLLEQFEHDTREWREENDEKMETFASLLHGLSSRVEVLNERVAVHAAIGACIGGGLVAAIAAGIVALLN